MGTRSGVLNWRDLLSTGCFRSGGRRAERHNALARLLCKRWLDAAFSRFGRVSRLGVGLAFDAFALQKESREVAGP